MGVSPRKKARAPHSVPSERLPYGNFPQVPDLNVCRTEMLSLRRAGGRTLFKIPFSGRRKAPERANVILTVSRAHGKRHLVCRSAPAGACRGQPGEARLLGRRPGSGAIGVTRLEKHKVASCWRWNLCFLAERKVPGLRARHRNERSEFRARSNTRIACDRPARFR